MRIRIGEKPDVSMLPIGGTDKVGNRYEVNNKYLLKNGKPILPIMGEFHFSRWAPSEWEQAILKMKAGGIQILATYVFWIHHEEKKGEWDFAGSKDIKKFLEICKKVNMPVWLRIGPWAHGECRNGGLPDWLVEELGTNGIGINEEARRKLESQGKQVREARTNDELYMKYVREFWTQLAYQVKGAMCKDGGAIIGIQLENEYCHAGGPSDKKIGREHMSTLKELALELGFETPYYTATGWGGAIVLEKETIPVLGGYVDAPWAGHIKEMPACENFLIMPFREDENIGADLKNSDEHEENFSKNDNPYLTAELGGGLQATALRRTYPFARDTEAQSLCMLAAGANLLGYYMYHGGFNPKGKYSTLQESRATGYFNDLPIRSYDFEACIHESGKLNESYHRLKRMHTMINCFEDCLTPAMAYFPDVLPNGAEDMTTPRISIRYNHDTKEGFLFVNNHQRLRKMNTIKGLDVTVENVADDIMTIKNINCASGECAIIPFNMKMGNTRLKSTNACLLGKIKDRYFFYYDENAYDQKPYFEYDGEIYDNIVLLTKEQADNAYIFNDKLYITSKAMYQKNDKLYMLTGEEEEKVTIYDAVNERLEMCLLPPEKLTYVSVNSREVDECEYKKAIELANKYNDIAASDDCKVYNISLSIDKMKSEHDTDEGYIDELNEIYVNIDFNGDKAQLYADGELLTDWFANGADWFVALKRYGYPKELVLIVYPYEENVYYDLPAKKGCALNEVQAETEYCIQV